MIWLTIFLILVTLALLKISSRILTSAKALKKDEREDDYEFQKRQNGNLTTGGGFNLAGKICGGLAALMFIFSCIVKIDAGEVGVPVLFGKVQEQSLSEGLNLVNPFINVSLYPIRLQQYTMSAKIDEGDVQGDDSINVRTLDEQSVGLDLTMWWRLDGEKAYAVYREIAPDFDDLIDKVVRPALRTVTRDQSIKYEMKELISKRDSYVSNLFLFSKAELAKKYIIVDKILLRNVDFPDVVDEAIKQKQKIRLESEAKEFEKVKAQKDAEIKVIEARGLAEAQSIIDRTLSSLYLQHEAIQAFEKLSASDNAKIILVPMSPKGSGMPNIIVDTGSYRKKVVSVKPPASE